MDRKRKDGGGAVKPAEPKIAETESEPRRQKLETAVMLNTGLRVGGWVALVCSRFPSGEAPTARFFEEAKLRTAAHCHEHGTTHRVRPIFDAFGEGLFEVGGRYGEGLDFHVDVAQLVFLTARAENAGAIAAFPSERRTA